MKTIAKNVYKQPFLETQVKPQPFVFKLMGVILLMILMFSGCYLTALAV